MIQEAGGMSSWAIKIAMVALWSMGVAWAQADISGQFQVIRGLMPGATTVAVIIDAKGSPLDGELGGASADNDLKVLKVPIQSIRDMAAALNAVLDHNPSFIYFENSENLGGKNSIKFIAKSALKNKVPVYTAHAAALESGAFGQLQQGATGWTIVVNGKVKEQYAIEIPEGDARFLVQN
jgi:ABC-type uncharacterized transport system substrate-binding protein